LDKSKVISEDELMNMMLPKTTDVLGISEKTDIWSSDIVELRHISDFVPYAIFLGCWTKDGSVLTSSPLRPPKNLEPSYGPYHIDDNIYPRYAHECPN